MTEVTILNPSGTAITKIKILRAPASKLFARLLRRIRRSTWFARLSDSDDRKAFASYSLGLGNQRPIPPLLFA